MDLKKAFYNKVQGPRHHWWALTVAGLGTFMTTYDVGAVSISLPRIMASFQTGLGAASWVLLSYLLTVTSFLLPAGRLGDLIGRKKIYIIGFIVFITGSALCGLSRSSAQLILCRILQAAGAAMLHTNSFAIISAAFPERDRGKGLGVISTVAGIGITAGPAIGGLIVDALGWRGIFFLNVPVGLAGAVLSHLILSEEIVSAKNHNKTIGRFDIGGSCLVTVAIGSLLFGLSLGQKGNWASWETCIFLSAAVLALVAFPWFESRKTLPLVDIRLFKDRNFVLNNAARLIFVVGLATSALLMPFFLQVVQGYSPSRAGLLIAPASLIMAVSAPVAGWLTNRISARILTCAGMTCLGLSLFGMSRLNPSSGYTGILGLLLLLGFGNGVFQTPNNTSVMDSVPRENFGIASGILALVREIGRALGVALATTIVVSSTFTAVGKVSIYSLDRDTILIDGGNALSAFANGIGKAFLAASLLSILGVIFSMGKVKTARDRGIHTGSKP